MRKHLVPYVHKVDRNGTHSQVVFWKARHLPGLRLTANGTQNDKAEAGSIPVLTTKNTLCIEIKLH